MYIKILNTLKSQKGAMDKILVTLILVIIGISLTVGLSIFFTEQEDSAKEAATKQINSVLTEVKNEN